MPEDPNDKFGAKLDTIISQVNQTQVDMATIKGAWHGDMENVKMRLTGLEAWRESWGKTTVTLLVGIFISVCAGIVLLLIQGKLHG